MWKMVAEQNRKIISIDRNKKSWRERHHSGRISGTILYQSSRLFWTGKARNQFWRQWRASTRRQSDKTTGSLAVKDIPSLGDGKGNLESDEKNFPTKTDFTEDYLPNTKIASESQERLGNIIGNTNSGREDYSKMFLPEGIISYIRAITRTVDSIQTSKRTMRNMECKGIPITLYYINPRQILKDIT